MLVKDLSRLGRHRIQTELYIDHLRQNNVKVYSVTEGIDSTNENDDLLIGFKQIFNDFYAKDISKKIRTGLRQKQRSNGLVETLPLGYRHDKNTGEVLIDEETAWIVRKIFELYVQGYGLTTIARKMNADGIRSPEYYFRRKLADWKPDISKKYLWVQTAVKRILTNELYIGIMVNHKTVTNKIYKTKSAVPAEEQYRHENFCEPIIDEVTWTQAQGMLAARSQINPRSRNGNKLHRYAGLLKCGDCGGGFVARNRRYNGNEYVDYTCNSSHRYGKEYCSTHCIRESDLDDIVKYEVQNYIERLTDESKRFDKIMKDWQRNKYKYARESERIAEKIRHIKDEIEQLVIERIGDRAHAEVYNNMISKREQQIAELEKKIEDTKNYDLVCKEKGKQLDSTAKVIEKMLKEGEISDANLRLLVKKIVIHQAADKKLSVEVEMNGDFDGTEWFVFEPEESDSNGKDDGIEFVV